MHILYIKIFVFSVFDGNVEELLAITWGRSAVITPMLLSFIVCWTREKVVFNKFQLNHIQWMIWIGITGIIQTTPTAAQDTLHIIIKVKTI